MLNTIKSYLNKGAEVVSEAGDAAVDLFTTKTGKQVLTLMALVGIAGCRNPETEINTPETNDTVETGDTGDTEAPACDATCCDGQDNNGDGLTDAADPFCNTGYDDERFVECNDDKDNDGDGWNNAEGTGTISADPECENAWDDSESEAGAQYPEGYENHYESLAYPVEDTGMAGDTGLGLSVESTNWGNLKGYEGESCGDGVDNDADGWADYADPECK